MKEYIDYLLKKNKKPIDFELLCERIECLRREKEGIPTLSREDKVEIQKILEEEVSQYEYFVTPEGRYALLSKTPYRKGRLRVNKAGEGIVSTTYSYIDKEDTVIVREEKFSILKENLGEAIDGDLVLIDIGFNKRKPKVEKVLERTIGTVLGEITRLGDSYFVKPIDKKQGILTIALEGDYIEGTIVLVSLEEINTNFYKGKVIQEYHHKDDPHADSLYEAFKSGMPHGFSEESLKQLESIPTSVDEKEKIGRYNFTDWEVFSIDGADTKDKDDCISLKVLDNGNYLLGVHIADVPYYVPMNSPLHKDSFRKGTSYYFGGSVEPELPRKLSNGICSLNDGVDRLTKSILIEYDKSGNVVSRSLVRGVIRSQLGMTYDKVNQILKEGVVGEEYKAHEKTLLEMAKLALTLRKKRVQQGAIQFSRPEIYFVHDEEGKAVECKLYYQDVANHLIEEFMLAANVNVGEILTSEGIPVPYRIHDLPNREKLGEFLRFLDIIGIPFGYTVDEICMNKGIMQELTRHVRDKGGDLTSLLNTNLIRCMSHALYSTTNIGHYGTGFPIYCHFTSPIRRLADDTLSRIIDDCYLEKDFEKKKRAIRKWKVLAQEYSEQASKMERVAEEVEKNVTLMDTAVYFGNHLGEEYEGTVISVSGNGLVVQLDNLLEGRIRTKNLSGSYVYNPLTFTLLSLDGFDSYSVGDRLKVRVKSAEKETKTVDFSVLEKIKENPIRDITNSNQKVKMIRKKEKNRRTFS